MKLKHLTVTLFAAGLLSGCVNPSGDYCDIAEPIWFDTADTVNWLLNNDESALRAIVTHNEQVERLCS